MLFLKLHKRVLRVWNYYSGAAISKSLLVLVMQLFVYLLDGCSNGAVFVNRQKNPIDTFYTGDYECAFVFLLKFFAAFQGKLLVVIHTGIHSRLWHY